MAARVAEHRYGAAHDPAVTRERQTLERGGERGPKLSLVSQHLRNPVERGEILDTSGVRFKRSRPDPLHRCRKGHGCLVSGTRARASHRCRTGFKANSASSAVAPSIAMMAANTGIQDWVHSCNSAATGPPSTEPTPCAM